MCGKMCGIVVVAIAALIVHCSADPHQEQDVTGNEHVSQYDGQKARLQDMLNLARVMRDSRQYAPYPVGRRYDWSSMYRNPEYNDLYLEGYPKRNFDEIDRSDLDKFVRKRNFDEIDLSLMPLPYTNKRFLHGRNNRPISSYLRSVDKKTIQNNFDAHQDFKMDEIDLSAIPFTKPYSMDKRMKVARRRPKSLFP